MLIVVQADTRTVCSVLVEVSYARGGGDVGALARGGRKLVLRVAQSSVGPDAAWPLRLRCASRIASPAVRMHTQARRISFLACLRRPTHMPPAAKRDRADNCGEQSACGVRLRISRQRLECGCDRIYGVPEGEHGEPSDGQTYTSEARGSATSQRRAATSVNDGIVARKNTTRCSVDQQKHRDAKDKSLTHPEAVVDLN